MSERLIRSSADMVALFGDRIRELGLSHREIDDLAGFGEGYTSKIMCGDRQPGARTIERMCRVLKVAFVPTVVVDAQ
jgi:predicted transcriptional regulator